MKRAATLIMSVALSGGILMADIVDCGDEGEHRDFPFEMTDKKTDYHCEPEDAVAQMEQILTSLGASASPDICSECTPPETGCSRIGHTDPGPGYSYYYEGRDNYSCPVDNREHRLVIVMPAPQHYITCTGCS